MSTSAHPIALRLERRVGGATRLLATVMALPLIDGIFPALVIAGALTVPFGIIETGLLIFGGSATMAVVLAEMEGTPREKAASILLLGAVIVPVAVAEAALAETIQSLLNPDVFHRFAGLVILAVAAKTASAKIGEYLPSPSIIIGLGLVASINISGAALVVNPNPGMILRAVAAAGADAADDATEEDDEVDVELLSDEERVERLLDRNGGRMKQASIVKETGWSNAKVSQLLSAMEDDDRIDKLRIGRENLISFPDEDVTDLDSE